MHGLRSNTPRSRFFRTSSQREVLAVHRDVDARRQHLRERQRAAEIEEPVGAAERVGHHRAGQHDRLVVEPGRGERARGLDHRVGAVGDDDRPLRARAAALDDRRAAGVVHVEAVDHHHGLDRDVQPRPPEPQHLADVRVAEEQPAGQLVVLLVERAAGDEDGERLGHVSKAGIHRPTTVLQYPALFCPSIQPLSALLESPFSQEGLDAQGLTRFAQRSAPGLRQRPAGRNSMFAVSLALIGVLGIFIVRRRSTRKKQGLA